MLEECSRQPAAVFQFTRAAQVSNQQGSGDLPGWTTGHAPGTPYTRRHRGENQGPQPKGDAWSKHSFQPDRVFLEGWL